MSNVSGRAIFSNCRRHRYVRCFLSLQLSVMSIAWMASLAQAVQAGDTSSVVSIEPGFKSLRNKAEREWSDFAEQPDGRSLSLTFSATTNQTECSLTLRQQDVKETWTVSLNGKRLGELIRDENDMTIWLAVPAGALKDGDNKLVVEAQSTAKTPSDDVRVGLIALYRRPSAEVLAASTLDVSIVDEVSREPLPGRITVVDANGSLASFGTKSDGTLAVRVGVTYTANGNAKLKLTAGTYRVFAGRGFEYSLGQADFRVEAGQTHRQVLAIRREVSTPGFVACDTHLHTLTHSGHGDASVDERVITLAGEAIELPIATDHNIHVDYEPIVTRLNVRQYFTPVTGNEVTTARGHFNIFPIQSGARVVDHRQTDWGQLFDNIYETPGVRIAILNHARDLHSGVRPFGPAVHNSVVGENLEGWPLRFNAMEVVNSGATQTDVLQLFRDWMGLLNHGYQVTPVGSSDSHDVARYIPGQGRTYIRCDDRDVANLDVASAVSSFLQGQVMVSYGLLTELSVNKTSVPGDLVPAADQDWQINVRVLGPQWVSADRVMLFANGILIREEAIAADNNGQLPRGVKWQGRWTIPRQHHDRHLVAIAVGPGIDAPYWRTAKPYQPTSTDATTHVIGCSGAIWLDEDGDGQRTSARDYALQLVATDGDNLDKLLPRLADYDEATASQVAYLLRLKGVTLTDNALQSSLNTAAAHVKAGFQAYIDAWKENETARATKF